MNIKRALKKKFPGMYDYHLHLLRKKKIKQIHKLKQLPETEYPQMLAETYDINPEYSARSVGLSSIISILTLPVILKFAEFFIEFVR